MSRAMVLLVKIVSPLMIVYEIIKLEYSRGF